MKPGGIDRELNTECSTLKLKNETKNLALKIFMAFAKFEKKKITALETFLTGLKLFLTRTILQNIK